ncbi:BMP4 [Mytilus coruscus]|uniref:BMP4 n=1 Tax=Mytilus coruscus TaxID=42192 RepID=A0A6J8E3C7_MYTCO|nr:BMP4 [Mytilus coruscus]
MFVEILLLSRIAVSAFGNDAQSLLEIMNEAANDSSDNSRLKERFLTPYVLNVFERMDNLDSGNNAQLSGKVRILIPEEDDNQRDNGDEKTLTFNLSEVLHVNTTAAHLVISNHLPRTTVQIHYRNIRIEADYTSLGLVADVTEFIGGTSETIILKVFIQNLRNVQIDPVLAVFENFSPSQVSNLEMSRKTQKRRKRSEKQGSPIEEYSRTLNSTFDPNICGLKSWIVEFKVLGWNNWLWAPKSYEANICYGICPTPFGNDYYNASQHAIIKNYFHIATGFNHTSIPRACCTPIEYDRITIIYLSKDRVMVVKSLPMVRATKCGCR